jgi:AraC-like DNA-binding protein
MDHMQVNHNVVPQKNINLRINLSDTSHHLSINNKEYKLEEVYFPGMQNKFLNARLILNGNVDVLGICFEPDGIYPFLKIPASEFKNQVLGADEIGFKTAKRITEKLKEIPDVPGRLALLEMELLSLLKDVREIPVNFRKICRDITHLSPWRLSDFCRQNFINPRQLERMYAKYIGLSASTYLTLIRFHESVNQMLSGGYSKMSDLAYDNEYFDQVHFIKEFKRFSGKTPLQFLKQEDSILQIGKLK